MAGIITAIEAVSKIMEKGTAVDAETVERLENIGTLITTNGSITKLLSKFIIEPILVCSKGVKNTEVYDNILQINLDIFSAFYMQAFKILQEVYGINARMTFDVLSTDNSVALSNVMTSELGKTVIKRLSTASDGIDGYAELFSKNPFLRFSSESKLKNIHDEEYISMNKLGRVESLMKENDSKISENLYGTLQRTFDVNIGYKAKKDNNGESIVNIKVPITVKSHVIVTDIHNIIAMLKPNATDKTFSYRLDEYKSGAISLKELIFCTDIIKEYKQNRLKDKDGLASILASRSTNSKLRMVQTSGMQGFEKNYNMLIVTSDDKVYLDKHLNGDIMNEKFKQKLLEEANAMTITIADDDYERVNILTRDIRGVSDVGYKQLKKKKNGDMSEVGELLKSLLMSKPMSF